MAENLAKEHRISSEGRDWPGHQNTATISAINHSQPEFATHQYDTTTDAALIYRFETIAFCLFLRSGAVCAVDLPKPST